MSNPGSGPPANHQPAAAGMAGQQPTLPNNLPTSVNSVQGGQPTNSLSFSSETQVLLPGGEKFNLKPCERFWTRKGCVSW